MVAVYNQPRLEEFETKLEIRIEGWPRQWALRAIHDYKVNEFVNAPGFGAMRMIHPGPEVPNLPKPSAPEQSVEWPSSDHPPVPTAAPAPDGSTNLAEVHRNGVLDFLNLPGFGYAKDRRRVAGFQPHGFSKAVDGAGKYAVERVDLVSLLLHPGPAVYLSDRLPSMEHVRDYPTRPLDRFEEQGLKMLRAGEDLVSASNAEKTRAFGSIRSARQCVTCHGGERGELLGAFSYTLRESPGKKP
jgi:hypothetical protein